jgi:hypothetical protein
MITQKEMEEFANLTYEKSAIEKEIKIRRNLFRQRLLAGESVEDGPRKITLVSRESVPWKKVFEVAVKFLSGAAKSRVTREINKLTTTSEWANIS